MNENSTSVRKSLVRAVSFAAVMAAVSNAQAGSISSAKVVEIGMANGTSNMAFVQFESALNSLASCANSSSPFNARLVFDASTNRGKALLSALTAAMYAQRPVNASGDLTCSSLAIGNITVPLENLRHAVVLR